MVINPLIIFYLLISIILFNFIKDYFLNYLNSKFFDKKIPENLSDIYDKEKCFSPIPSLAIHCTNVNSIFGLSPTIDFKKLWEDSKL